MWISTYNCFLVLLGLLAESLADYTYKTSGLGSPPWSDVFAYSPSLLMLRLGFGFLFVFFLGFAFVKRFLFLDCPSLVSLF